MDDLKVLAKEAKKRLKTGFWEANHSKIAFIKNQAKTQGIDSSNIIKYYQTVVTKEQEPEKDHNEVFYKKVKKILDSVGEVSDIIRRLIDFDEYNKMNYEKKQRYVMELSSKYRLALDRYKREKKLNL